MHSLWMEQGPGARDGPGGWLQGQSGLCVTACSGEPDGGATCSCVVLVRASSLSFSLCELKVIVSHRI